MSTISHKRGDTLSMSCVRTTNGVPVNLTGYTITSQIRDRYDALVATLTPTIANQTTDPGEFTLTATAAQTALWPIGSHVCDIEYVHASTGTSSTETFGFSVIKDVTR